ncbi:hypothetical protein KIN34_04565 [Cellulomonas sp. DKR-3]|uniref:Integral membrane protein n=1 Tax=Cellulomonas fulva TaxID=2835530 RepID=A0ABS5TWM9_9CELL|nr:permease prefix domain 1-containing protein [Cellulomonas fulva]MBT0993557.1 hypothetical protein [Cellulomonas fulva]
MSRSPVPSDAPTSLRERYVDAAMRTVPERQREDLAAELRAAIADQVDARVEAGEEPEVAERTVLTGLGDPDRLAAGYTDRPLHLIGPDYFLDWRRLLTLLLWIVVPCAAVGVAIAQGIDGASFGSIVGTVVTTSLAVAVNLGFWTTAVFAVVERTVGRADLGLPAWDVDRLPQPRPRGTGLGEMVVTLVLLAFAAGAVLWDHAVGWVLPDEGARQSLLDPDLWPGWIGYLLVVLALDAIVAVAVYARQRWTYGLAAANAVLDLAFAVPALWLLTEGRLVNDAVFPELLGEGGTEAAGVLAVLVACGIVAGSLWSAVDGFLKARRERTRAA